MTDFDITDQAYKTWRFATSEVIERFGDNGRKADIRDNIDDQFYLVIGDFAYVLGHNGSLYAAPVKEYQQGRLVQWENAVDLDYTETNRNGDDLPEGFPVNRIKNVLSDMHALSDVMFHMGCKVQTRK